jgi:polysaccharide export outer membrane protein
MRTESIIKWFCLSLAVAGGLALGGCASGRDERFADIGEPPPPAAAAPAQTQPDAAAVHLPPGPTDLKGDDQMGIDVLRVGDNLLITFKDLPMPMPPVEDRIRQDGTITLLYNKTFKAADKTRGGLEQEIRQAYVPSYFKEMTVTVVPQHQTQFYYVGGEVKLPGRQVYIGRLTVTKAIQSCGDFTDFAKKTKVKLKRVDGRQMTIDCTKAVTDPKLDPEVYPGDQIHVPRRIIF